MSIDVTTEKRFEEDIEAFFISPTGGYTKGTDTYDPALGLYVNTLIEFIQRTQPKEWARFENQNKVDPVRKFCLALVHIITIVQNETTICRACNAVVSYSTYTSRGHINVK